MKLNLHSVFSDFKRFHNLSTIKGFERKSSIILSQSSSLKTQVSSDLNTNHGTICVNRSSGKCRSDSFNKIVNLTLETAYQLLGSKRMKNLSPFSSGLRVSNSFEDNCFANLVQSPVNNGLIIGKVDNHKIASNNNKLPHPVANSLSMLAKNSGDSSTFELEHLQCILNRRQRGEKRPIPNEQKDEKYFERRKRNNEAAKKSRDARKIREDRVSIFYFNQLVQITHFQT